MTQAVDTSDVSTCCTWCMCHKWMLKFLFKKLIYVNWRIITLQQCDGFFATHQYEPAIGTHISPPSCTPLTFYPTPSLQVSTEPPLWVPWVIHQTCMVFICCTYGNVYVSVLFSQVIPPSPSHIEPKVCPLHLCLFCCLAYRCHYHLNFFQSLSMVYLSICLLSSSVPCQYDTVF